MNVDEIAREIVAREGGFVNDPADPGGATKYGVTSGTMRAPGLDKTGDGRVAVEDVKALTRADAVRIFQERYFHGPRIDLLPEPYALNNSGPLATLTARVKPDTGDEDKQARLSWRRGPGRDVGDIARKGREGGHALSAWADAGVSGQ